MSVIQGNAIESGVSTYQIERSLRFNSADSAYLSRTPASAGNRKTWTWSGWLKITAVGTRIFDSGTNADNWTSIGTNGNGTLYTEHRVGDVTQSALVTTQVFRDPSAWYHIMVVWDTTQATSSNRIKIYVNGTQVTAFSTSNYGSQNTDTYINSTNAHYLGAFNTVSQYFNGYMAEVHFIDGSALDPTSFGEYNSETGVWQPKAYTGSYGTNGFYLDFADNSSTTALGYDAAGSNDWTPNNFSVTAGAGNDSLVDTPTPYGTDTGVGAEVRGNYCTMSPILGGGTTNVNGNLDVTCPDNKSTGGTFGMSSGKWYFEATVASANYVSVGIARNDEIWGTNLNGSSEAFMYSYVGTVYTKGSADTTPDSFTTNDIISVCVDLDNNKLYFLKNGTGITVAAGTQNPSTGANGISLDAGYTYFSAITANGNSAVAYFNFGQRPFAYTAPSGFAALCTQNLPEPTVVDGADYFNAVLYTGNAATNTITTGFAPDLVWIKDRVFASGADHFLFDKLRTTYSLSSNTTGAETQKNNDGFTSLDSTGFTLNGNGGGDNINRNASSFVAWNWKAGGTGVSNTAGSITSTVSANTTAGFSVVTYTGNGTSGATIGHGLGVVAPSMLIVKSRGTTDSWGVYHTSIGNTKGLYLETTGAAVTSSAFWNNTSPTSTVFSVSNNSINNASSTNYVAYVFAPVEGYSAFGSYTGNGSSTDGPFVFCNFRPRFILFKKTNDAGDWNIRDTSRSPYNVVGEALYPNLSYAEYSGTETYVDILSNGFKLRGNWNSTNASGGTYIYAAFAEVPMKFALGR